MGTFQLRKLADALPGVLSILFFLLQGSIAVAEVNLLPNGSFERSSSGGIPATWTKVYSGTPTVMSGVSTRCGDYVLRLVDSSSSSSAGLQSQHVPVVAGSSYTAGSYISRAQTTNTAARLDLQFFDSAGAQVGSYSGSTSAAANTWEYVSITADAPTNAATARVLCYSTIASTGTMYFDGISLKAARPMALLGPLTRYISPAGSGTGTGLSSSNPAKYNNAAFWTGIKAALNTNAVKVVFLEGEYVMDQPAAVLRIEGIGNRTNKLTLEGERPFGSVFTRTDAALTNECPPMLFVQRATNIVIRHLHWENDTTLPNRLVQYCLAIRSAATGNETRDIHVEGCSFVGLSWNIYGAMGYHYARTHGGKVSYCEFIRGGYDSRFHMIYNAYGSYDLMFQNNYFQDSAGAYLRLRAGCHDAVVDANEFVSTAAAYNQPFVQWATFNNIEPGDETFGYNFRITRNMFNYTTTPGNVALGFYHSGFDPLRAPGLLWDYLLTQAEGDLLKSGTIPQKKTLLEKNFGVDFETQMALSDNTSRGFHTAAMNLRTASNQSYNYQDANGVWHICPSYGGDGTYNLDDILNTLTQAAPVLVCSPSGADWVFTWLGAGYKLQVQTNALSAGLGKDWKDVPGGTLSGVTVPGPSSANAAVFYRLISTTSASAP